jgi:hypothetical protein
MQELYDALTCGSDFPRVLLEAVREVLADVEKCGQDQKFSVIDYVSNLTSVRGRDSDACGRNVPKDVDTDALFKARMLVATCDWSKDFCTSNDDIYSSAMTGVMDGCLELAAACHMSYTLASHWVRGQGRDQEQGKEQGKECHDILTERPANLTPEVRAPDLQAMRADLGASLDRLPDACLAVLRFFLLRARLPDANEISISAEGAEEGAELDKERLVRLEQQLQERAHVICCAARLSSTALVLAARLAIATWIMLSKAGDKNPSLSIATRSAVRAHLLIFRALADGEQDETVSEILERCNADTLLRFRQEPLQQFPFEFKSSSVIVNALSLAAPSEHELLRVMRLRATAARVLGVNVPHGGSVIATMAAPPLAFSIHDQEGGVCVELDLRCILSACTLRGNPCVGHACSAALMQIDSLAGPNESSPLLALALQLAQIRTACQDCASAGSGRVEEGEVSHVRACCLLTFVLLREVRGRDGSRSPPLSADVAMQFAACSLPIALALSSHYSSRQLGEGEGAAAALRQVTLLGSLYVHEVLGALGQSQLQMILPWALPQLLQAWAASSTVDEPGAKVDQHVVFTTTMLQARALHAVFAACCGQGQAVGALHTYLDSFIHKLGLQSSSPVALWRLLSQSQPFWEAAAALHDDHALPADGLTAAVAMRLQPLLRALLDALNHCWHLPVQYLILRILFLLFERQRRDSATGMPILLRSSAPAVATECLRVLAFYRGPGPGVDLTSAPPDSCLRLERAARTLLDLLRSVNAPAVDCLMLAVGVSLSKEG